MGQRLTDGCARRAWSRLSQSPGVRNGVRVLVFAGAVGATWFLGSAASAHTGADPELEAQPPSAESGVERPVENNTGLDQLLLPLCPDVPPESPEATTDREHATDPEEATDDSAATTSPSSALTDFPLLSAKSVITCRTAHAVTGQGADPTPHHGISTASNFQPEPSTDEGQRGQNEGTASAGPDSVTGPLSPLTGEIDPLLGSLGQPVRSVADETMATVPPVDHTGRWLTGTVADPLLDVTRPLFATAAPIVRPAVDTLAGVTGPVTDKVTGAVLPSLDGAVDDLVPLPVAGLPSGDAPALPASPVTPGADRSIGTTSTVDSADEVSPRAAPQTGSTVGAAPAAPAPPAPAPLPVVPGSGVTTGTTTVSYVPFQGGGVAATVPASLDQSAPESSALLATAHEAALRDLAGEPAVSPD